MSGWDCQLLTFISPGFECIVALEVWRAFWVVELQGKQQNAELSERRGGLWVARDLSLLLLQRPLCHK